MSDICFTKKKGKVLAQKSKEIKEQHVIPQIKSYQQKTVTHLNKPRAPFASYYKNPYTSDLQSSVVTTDIWKPQVHQRLVKFIRK